MQQAPLHNIHGVVFQEMKTVFVRLTKYLDYHEWDGLGMGQEGNAYEVWLKGQRAIRKTSVNVADIYKHSQSQPTRL
jgi:hypothetical protein